MIKLDSIHISGLIMDPKGDRERKLKLGMLKLPDAVLKVRFHVVYYCQGS